MALGAAEAILNIPLDPEFPDPKIVTRKQAVIASVLSATVRVSANRLRGRDRDMMSEIIKSMAAHREANKQLH